MRGNAEPVEPVEPREMTTLFLLKPQDKNDEIYINIC